MSPKSCLATTLSKEPERKLRLEGEKRREPDFIRTRGPALWPIAPIDLRVKSPRIEGPDSWIFERLEMARSEVSAVVVRDPAIRHGAMVLKGTRFPVARVFAELSEDYKLSDIADNYDLDLEKLSRLFMALAVYLDE